MVDPGRGGNQRIQKWLWCCWSFKVIGSSHILVRKKIQMLDPTCRTFGQWQPGVPFLFLMQLFASPWSFLALAFQVPGDCILNPSDCSLHWGHSICQGQWQQGWTISMSEQLTVLPCHEHWRSMWASSEESSLGKQGSIECHRSRKRLGWMLERISCD